MTAAAREWPEGNAIVYCQGAFNTTYGKTAHGLVRRSERYRVLGVIDAAWSGMLAAVLCIVLRASWLMP